MARRGNVYIERRYDHRYEVKHRHQSNPGIVRDTQREAIDAARRRYPDTRPDVERVKHTSRGKPDQWRKA